MEFHLLLLGICQTLLVVSVFWSTVNAGTVYVRWGRTTCANTDNELVYAGFAAGGHYSHKGGGGDLICLSPDPQTHKPTSAQDTHAYIYGSEYQHPQQFFDTDNAPHGKTDANGMLHDEDVPCAVCRIKKRSAQVMIPGRKECHGKGWKMEYWGFLMTAHWLHASRNHVCVDIAPEAVPGGAANKDGAILYIVQAACGSLKCPPYTQNYELTCVVCSKK